MITTERGSGNEKENCPGSFPVKQKRPEKAKKMKTIKQLSFIILAIIFLPSCATIISGQRQQVSFSTDPSGAEIRVDGMPVGITPLSTKIKRTSHAVNFQKEEYKDVDYYFHAKFNGWYLGNLLLGGLPGMIVDLIVGSYQNIDDAVYKKMERINMNYSQNVEIRKPNIDDEISELKRKYEKKLITENEYERKKQDIISGKLYELEQKYKTKNISFDEYIKEKQKLQSL